MEEEWNVDDLCLYDKDKSYEILFNKLIVLKKEKRIAVIKNLDNATRKFIHEIARKCEINSQSVNKRGSKKNNVADLELNSEKELSPLPKYALKTNRKRKIMDNYIYHCCICSTDLSQENAMYNVFIGGPFCENCIRKNEELDCHKWETNSF